jgi:hypothetical protein
VLHGALGRVGWPAMTDNNSSFHGCGSRHAVTRLRERFGIELPAIAWGQIIDHAIAGLYAWMHADSRPGADTRVFAVPMGPSEAAAVWVPIVIDIASNRAITVLPHLPCDGHWHRGIPREAIA